MNKYFKNVLDVRDFSVFKKELYFTFEKKTNSSKCTKWNIFFCKLLEPGLLLLKFDSLVKL